MVELDRKAKTISYVLPHAGRVVTALKMADQYYAGTKPLNTQLWGKPLLSASFSINRHTGEANGFYATHSDGSGFLAFSGTCEPSRPKF